MLEKNPESEANDDITLANVGWIVLGVVSSGFSLFKNLMQTSVAG